MTELDLVSALQIESGVARWGAGSVGILLFNPFFLITHEALHPYIAVPCISPISSCDV